jgi:hypothetical protein
MRKTVKNNKNNIIPLGTMQEIWEDHHRQIREIDLKYKRNLKRAFTVLGLIILVLTFLLYKY